MKKYMSLCLTLILLFLLTGCQDSRPVSAQPQEPEAPVSSHQAEEQPPEESEESAPPAPSLPQESQEPTEDDAQETAAEGKGLTERLDELRENVRFGTAGSSLAAAQQASNLLDWAMETSMSEKQICETVADWYQTIPPEEQEVTQTQFSCVLDALEQVTGEDGWDLLDSAGCTDSSYPWNDAAKMTVETILSAIPRPE